MPALMFTTPLSALQGRRQYMPPPTPVILEAFNKTLPAKQKLGINGARTHLFTYSVHPKHTKFADLLPVLLSPELLPLLLLLKHF